MVKGLATARSILRQQGPLLRQASFPVKPCPDFPGRPEKSDFSHKAQRTGDAAQISTPHVRAPRLAVKLAKTRSSPASSIQSPPAAYALRRRAGRTYPSASTSVSATALGYPCRRPSATVSGLYGAAGPVLARIGSHSGGHDSAGWRIVPSRREVEHSPLGANTAGRRTRTACRRTAGRYVGGHHGCRCFHSRR